jgi:mannosyltransferase
MLTTRRAIFALFLIILFSVTVYLSSQSIRLDESQTIWVTTKPIQTVWKLIAQDVHVPLYFTILHYWIQIFGNDTVTVRIPSFIFYLLTLYVVYKFSQEAANRNAAYLAVFLFSLSPFVLWYSFEARMYTQFAFFSSLSTLFFLRMLRSEGENGKLGFFISTALGVYTHYFYLFFLFSQGIYLFGDFLIAQSKSGFLGALKQKLKLEFSFLSLSAVAVLLLAPWFFYVITLGEISSSEPLIPPPSSFNIFQTFAFFLFGYQSPVTQGLIVALWPMTVVLLFFVFTQRKKMQVANLGYFEVITFLPILLFFLVSFVRPIFLARYLIFTVPTLFFLVANVLLVFSKKISSVLITVTFIILFGFLFYQNISSSTPVKENYRGVTEFLNNNVLPSDIVAVTAPFTIYPIEYSYRGTARIDTIPPWDRFSQGPVPEFSIENLQKQIEDYSKLYTRVFVVLSYDQGYESRIRDYMDKNYQLVGSRVFSPGLELRVYQLRYL